MQETPEDRYLRERIESVLRPHVGNIKTLQDEVKKLKQDDVEHNINTIDSILNKIDLFTKFKVFLEMQYLNLTVGEDTCCTDEEFQQANEWATDKATYLVHQFMVWEKNEAPLFPASMEEE